MIWVLAMLAVMGLVAVALTVGARTPRNEREEDPNAWMRYADPGSGDPG